VIAVTFDAIILAGGRASRLGGVAKPSLTAHDGTTALSLVLATCWDAGARRVVLVGPPDDLRRDVGTQSGEVIIVQEQPAWSGPARAIAAGMSALADNPADAVLVLACDMPNAALGVHALLSAQMCGDGAVALANGRRQWLLTLCRWQKLADVCRRLPKHVAGGRDPSVKQLMDGLDLCEVTVPAMVADDLDTPDDMARLRFAAPNGASLQKGTLMHEFEIAGRWLDAMRNRIDLTDLEEPDMQALLNMVRDTAHSVIHAAGPVAAFAAGYATARAGGSAAESTRVVAELRDLASDHTPTDE